MNVVLVGKNIKMVKAECHFCKKKYKGYPIIINNNIESWAMEAYIKNIFYFDKEDGHKKDIGVCEKCRKIHIYQNNIFLSQAWFTVWVQLQANMYDLKNNNDDAWKKFDKAIKRVKTNMKKVDKTPEVIKEHKKNNPAHFKAKLKKKKPCSYCGQNHGQVWINDPNNTDKPKSSTCWWVCKPCKKIIDKQGEMSFFMHISDKFKEFGIKDAKKKADKKVKELTKEISDIANEDGQKVFSLKITKKDKTEDKNGNI